MVRRLMESVNRSRKLRGTSRRVLLLGVGERVNSSFVRSYVRGVNVRCTFVRRVRRFVARSLMLDSPFVRLSFASPTEFVS